MQEERKRLPQEGGRGGGSLRSVVHVIDGEGGRDGIEAERGKKGKKKKIRPEILNDNLHSKERREEMEGGEKRGGQRRLCGAFKKEASHLQEGEGGLQRKKKEERRSNFSLPQEIPPPP